MGAYILKDLQSVFIHIPKTGGLSIRRGAFDIEPSGATGPFFGSINPKFDHYFKFTFVRNPFDRLLSAWRDICFRRTQWRKSKVSFLEFLRVATDSSLPFKGGRTMQEVIRHHTLPQTHSFHCFHLTDFIGRFENLQQDFNTVCDKMGIPQNVLPHKNKSKHEHYAEYYDDETREIVAENYAQDIEHFGYQFGHP